MSNPDIPSPVHTHMDMYQNRIPNFLARFGQFWRGLDAEMKAHDAQVEADIAEYEAEQHWRAEQATRRELFWDVSLFSQLSQEKRTEIYSRLDDNTKALARSEYDRYLTERFSPQNIGRTAIEPDANATSRPGHQYDNSGSGQPYPDGIPIDLGNPGTWDLT